MCVNMSGVCHFLVCVNVLYMVCEVCVCAVCEVAELTTARFPPCPRAALQSIGLKDE